MNILKPSLLLLFVTLTQAAYIKRDEGNCTHLLDVIAVVDGSDSIVDEDFDKLQNAVIKLAESLDLAGGSQRFGAIVFSSSVSETIPLSSNLTTLKTEITDFKHPKMGTSTHKGIIKMKDMFEKSGRSSVPQVGIVITDGRSISPSETEAAAKQAKDLGIRMIAVGVGYNVNVTELRGIATKGDDVKQISNFDKLQTLVSSLIRKYCIVNGKWSPWSNATVGPCSATCGDGFRTLSYTRTCSNPPPKNGGKNCVGPSSKMETETCKEKECPVPGRWTPWKTTEGKCSVSCGGGVKTITKTRTCIPPKFGGAPCSGSNSTQRKEECGKTPCPVPGRWTPWETTEEKCSVSCGGGVKTITKTRTCIPPKFGGAPCSGSNTTQRKEECGKTPCPVPGRWTPWETTEEKCSVSCGGGVKTITKTRTCIPPKFGGAPCSGSNSTQRKEECGKTPCPVPGRWTPWKTTEEKCSVSCGGGVKTITKSRTCIPPKFGGAPCSGSNTTQRKEECGKTPCPVPGRWTPWKTTEEKCSVSCGGGVKTITKTRTCIPPKFGGAPCSGSNTTQRKEECGKTPCPGPNPCSGCRYKNGVGYMSHPTDCRFFLQCIDYGATYFVMPCPAGLYWDQKHLTCTKKRKNCLAGIPEAEAADEPVPTETWTGSCDGTTRYISGNRNSYQQNVPNIGWVTRQCGPGTVYNSTICTCVHGGPTLSPTCKPVVYLPFNGNTQDESGHKVTIENVGVSVTKAEQAYFTSGTYLRMNRFSNMDFRNTLIIDFLLVKGSKTTRDQAIVSNAECEEKGSVYIIMRKDGMVEFRVINKAGDTNTLAVRYSVPKNGLPHVSLIISGGKMIAKVNKDVKTTSFKGDIAKSHCAVQIGKGTNYDSFKGLVDDFKMYLCKP